MSRSPRYTSVAPIALACLLVLAQWAGFSMVLCVGGPGHVEVESLDAPCCGRHAPEAGIFEDAGGSCFGCTDLSIETASTWNPSRRASPDGALAVLAVENAAGIAEAILACSRLSTPAPVPSLAATPLRC